MLSLRKFRVLFHVIQITQIRYIILHMEKMVLLKI